MTFALGAGIAMLIGIAGTSTIHLSKGVMKHGLSVPSMGDRSRSTARLVFTLGVLMNFTNPLWVIVANRFAPTVYYTSVYGLGLIALLLFSRRVLREPIRREQVAGALVIAVGTMVIGIAGLVRPAPSLFDAPRARLLWFAASWIAASLLAAVASGRVKLRAREVLFGVAGGGLAALDALVKGVSQSGPAGSSFLPSGASNWALFAVSFLGAAGAFGMIQWSFRRKCRASIMGAAYTVSYVALPLLVSPLLFGSPLPGGATIAGLAVLGVGIALVAGRTRTVGGSPYPGATSTPPDSASRSTTRRSRRACSAAKTIR